MFSFFKKKAEPPVTVIPEPSREDYILVGNGANDLPAGGSFYPQLTPQGFPPARPPPHTYQPQGPGSNPIAPTTVPVEKSCLAIEGVPFKIATNFQTTDAFSENVRSQIGSLNRAIERVEGQKLDYDFQTEKGVISEF